MSMPLMDAANYVGVNGPIVFGEEIQPNIMLDRELKKLEEGLNNSLKGIISAILFIYNI